MALILAGLKRRLFKIISDDFMGGGKRHKQKVRRITESDRAFQKIVTSDKFPLCHGKYPDCPPELTGAETKQFTDEQIPRPCKLCPYFKW